MSDITKKVTEEELDQIKELGSKYNTISAAFGQLRVQKLILEQQLEQVEGAEKKLAEDYVSNQEREQTLVKELNTKYGSGTLNPQTGEFTVQEKSEENPK